MRRKVRILAAAVPLVSGFIMLGTAGVASADPPENAGCVAQAVHSPAGPPGQTQSEAHAARFGQNVSAVAHIPPAICAGILPQ